MVLPAVQEGYVFKITSRAGLNGINAKLRECTSKERKLRGEGHLSAVLSPSLVAAGWRAIRDAGSRGIAYDDIKESMRVFAQSAGHVDRNMIDEAIEELKVPAKILSDADYRRSQTSPSQ